MLAMLDTVFTEIREQAAELDAEVVFWQAVSNRHLARAETAERERDEARADLSFQRERAECAEKAFREEWDAVRAAEQDAARLAEALEDIRLYGLDASDEPVWMRDRAARALAAHEARVGGGR